MACLRGIILISASAPLVVALTPTSISPFREGLRAGEGGQLQSQRQIFAPEGFGQESPAVEAVVDNCFKGRRLPEFYLLGAKNTATSSFSQDLRRLGVQAAPRDGRKEWNFFKCHDECPPETEQFAIWLMNLPPCPAEPSSPLLADFSVTTMATIPLPADFVWSQEFGYPAKGQSKGWDTARLIHDFYSLAGGRMPKMLVMFREPLARMQSEYYHTLPKENCVGCMANGSFADSFALSVELLQQNPPQMTDWAWKSFYARQVEEFLKYFDAAQFWFVPNREYFEIDPLAFSTSLLTWLGVPGEPWATASHWNEHPMRPPLDAELPPSAPSRLAFQAIMAPEEDRLVQVLASAQLQGATLAGYKGSQGDKAQIRAWLEAGW